MDPEKKYYFGTFLFFVAVTIALYMMATVVRYFRPAYAMNETVAIIAVSMLFGAIYVEAVKRIRHAFVRAKS